MDIAGAQGTPFQIAKLVEQKKGLMAGAAEVAIVRHSHLVAACRADVPVYAENDHLRQVNLALSLVSALRWAQSGASDRDEQALRCSNENMERTMKRKQGFVMTTILGGVVFLVPVIILVAIIGKALEIMTKVAAPLDAVIPIDNFAGVATVNILAIILILVVCLFAGLAAKSINAGKVVGYLETNLLSQIPGYSVVKGMATSIAGAEQESGMKTVFVSFDDYSQVAFEIERTAGGDVVLFLPGAPNAWSGTICVATADRVQPADASMTNVMRTMRDFGKGHASFLGDIRAIGSDLSASAVSPLSASADSLQGPDNA
jgi:uncharacterized membrane protein